MKQDPPAPQPPSRRRRAFFVVSGIILLAALYLFRGVLMPFFLAIVLAYVLAPLVGWLQRLSLGARKLPRWAAVATVYAVLLGFLGAFTALGAPRLVGEIENFTREVPELISTLRNEWLPRIEARLRSPSEPSPPETVTTTTPPSTTPPPSPVIRVEPTPDGTGYEVRLPKEGFAVTQVGDTYTIRPVVTEREPRANLGDSLTEALRLISEDTQRLAVTFLKTAQRVIRAIVKGVFTFFIVLMISAYLLATQDTINAFFRSLVRKEQQPDFDGLLVRIDRGLSGVVRGQLMICVVNGVLSGILFAALGLRYWPILTLIATVFSIIPIFGVIISSIPVVLVALQQSFTIAILSLVGIGFVHLLEANIFNPKILGDSAKVHPVLIVFALLAGEHLLGVGGALLAVPALSIVQSLFLHFRNTELADATPA